MITLLKEVKSTRLYWIFGLVGYRDSIREVMN